METKTIIEIMNNSEFDQIGNAPLDTFKNIEMHDRRYIKKHKQTHKTAQDTCKRDKDDATICLLKAEMRRVKVEKAVDCRFIYDDDKSVKNFADVLKLKQQEQEVSEFKKEDLLFSVHLYLADDPKNDVRPTATSMGVKLLDVQIMSYELSGRLVLVTFSGSDVSSSHI